MNKSILILATIFGASGIVLGAFGAHGLKQLVSAEAVNTFEVGVRYQIYHALFLLFVGIVPNISTKSKQLVLWLTFFGVLLFSGSIYFLATDSLFEFNFKKIAFITPIGGTFLISTWIMLLIEFFKIKRI